MVTTGNTRFTVLLLAAILNSSQAAPAAVVIDSFNSPISLTLFDRDGVADFRNDSSSGMIGSERELRVRDAHGGTGGCCTALSIDTREGSLIFWGNGNAPEQWASYGTALQNFSPFELNLTMGLSDQLQVDVLRNRQGGSLIVEFHTGVGDVSLQLPNISVGTTRIPLGSIPGMTAAHAANIDGIRLRASLEAMLWNDGLAISEVRIAPEPSQLNWGLIGIFPLLRPRRRMAEPTV